MSETINCVRATKITKGCVVKMRASSKLPGYGNAQCISDVIEELSTVSLYGHNQHYKIWDIESVIEYPFVEVGGNDA